LNKIKNIVVVVDSIDVDDSSGSKVNVALIQNLQTLGYHIEVFHYTRKDIQLRGVVCHSIKEKKYNLKYLLSRSQRVFTRFTKININRFIEGIIGFSFTFFNDVDSIRSFVLNNLKKQPDLIITISKGASFRPHYALLKLPKFHDKWLAYVHDPYPFHCYPAPYDWFEPGYKIKEAFFRGVSEKSKFSAFPSQLLKQWMGKYFPNFLETGFIIPHQYSSDFEDKSIEFPDFFETDKFTLMHAGNLMNTRPPIPLIKAYKEFLNICPEAKDNSRIYLLGNVNFYKDEIKKETKDLPQFYCSYGDLSYDVVNKMQKYISVGLIMESKGVISPFLPGKFSSCVMSDKMILHLGPKNSEIRRLLGEDYPYMAEIDNVDLISKLIVELYNHWKNDNQMNLNRTDLKLYVGTDYLEDQINTFVFN